MLEVESYDRIRRRVKLEGSSQREASRDLGHSRKTIRKALEYASPPGYRLTKERPRPVIGPVAPIIDAWVEADRKRPRKQRHTATRIWQRLREEYGFTGSERAVREYIRKRHPKAKEVFMPLSFDPGEEAQVDWGAATVIDVSGARTVQLFCMRVCHSRAPFVRAYETAELECFLDGHVRAFEYFGGVPRRLAYDNLKCAVALVGKGRERTLTKRFVELKSHYLFETRFCNRAKGNEKGHVENLVKEAQRQYLTPVPRVRDLTELNGKLEGECRASLSQPVRRYGEIKEQLLETERAAMLALPTTPFAACRTVSTISNAHALVRFGKNDYSVPVRYAHRACVVKAWPDRVEICVGTERIATHARSFGEGEYLLDPMHYLPLLEQKPGSLDNARAFKGVAWGPSFERMRAELERRYGSEGTRKYIRILLLFTEFKVTSVREAVETCARRGAWSDEAVKNVLEYEPARRSRTLDLSKRPELAGVGDGTRSLAAYDRLIGKEVRA